MIEITFDFESILRKGKYKVISKEQNTIIHQYCHKASNTSSEFFEFLSMI